MPNYSKMYCCSSLLISMYKYPAGTNITTYNVSAATDTNSRYRASPLQHMRAHTHTHTHISTPTVCCFCCVYLYDECVVSVVSGQIIICHLSGGMKVPFVIWTMNGALWKTSRLHTVRKTLMRPTALLPWRQEARFLTPWTHTIVFVLFSALVVNFTHNLSFCELERRYIVLLCWWSQCASRCSF